VTETPIFWADQVANEIVVAKKNFTAATGITPSGQIHIGNLREVLTADTIVKVLLGMKKEVKFYYIADTFDPLRRVYPFLDANEYTQHVGKPLSRIPGPKKDGLSYAEHFLKPFLQSLEELDIHVECVRANEMYEQGKYTDNIIKAMEGTDKIRAILKEETGKETESHWSPFNPICNKCARMTTTSVTGFDSTKKEVFYKCDCGDEGAASMNGGGKLTWRVDWPARWQMLGVTIEPFGKDHASSGGSYDTGVRFAREIFGYEPPFPIVYEWISLKGGGDMSSSKGNVLSVDEMLEIVPPEVLKYSILRVKPNRSIVFDPGLQLTATIDEYDDLTSKNRNHRAADIAAVPGTAALGAPFKHMVSLVQTTGNNLGEIEKILERTGYKVASHEIVKRRAEYALKWLNRFAPEEMKFTLQKVIPSSVNSLLPEQKKALGLIAEKLKPGMSAEEIHLAVYSVKDEVGLKPEQLFEAIYQSLLGKARGPRAGFFLASLDTKFVVERFKEASTR